MRLHIKFTKYSAWVSLSWLVTENPYSVYFKLTQNDAKCDKSCDDFQRQFGFADEVRVFLRGRLEKYTGDNVYSSHHLVTVCTCLQYALCYSLHTVTVCTFYTVHLVTVRTWVKIPPLEIHCPFKQHPLYTLISLSDCPNLSHPADSSNVGL